jgi:hypothetical protein
MNQDHRLWPSGGHLLKFFAFFPTGHLNDIDGLSDLVIRHPFALLPDDNGNNDRGGDHDKKYHNQEACN